MVSMLLWHQVRGPEGETDRTSRGIGARIGGERREMKRVAAERGKRRRVGKELLQMRVGLWVGEDALGRKKDDELGHQHDDNYDDFHST